MTPDFENQQGLTIESWRAIGKKDSALKGLTHKLSCPNTHYRGRSLKSARAIEKGDLLIFRPVLADHVWEGRDL